jgi:hypothetical protein
MISATGMLERPDLIAQYAEEHLWSIQGYNHEAFLKDILHYWPRSGLIKGI